MSISVTPASSAAWIVRIDRASSGRPSIDIGIPPRPIALTWTSPMRRLCMVWFLLKYESLLSLLSGMPAVQQQKPLGFST